MAPKMEYFKKLQRLLLMMTMYNFLFVQKKEFKVLLMEVVKTMLPKSY